MPDSNPYYGSFTGRDIDALLDKVNTNSASWDRKQDKITGNPGQTLKIDSDGNIVAVTPQETTAKMVSFSNSDTGLSGTNLQSVIIEINENLSAVAKNTAVADEKAENAQLAAETAQSTGNQAVSLANTAQSSADKAQKAVYDVTAVLNNAVANISALSEDIGELDSLTTEDKSDIVAAINELNGKMPNGLIYNGFMLWLAKDGEKIGEPVRIYNGADFEEVAVPIQQGSLIYNGTEQSPSWAGYNTQQMVMSGTSTATDAGTYYVTFSLLAGCCWPDGGTAALNIPWEIKRQPIYIMPSQSGSLTYTGEKQSPLWDNFDYEKLIIGGTISATDAGDWGATFTPTSNYCWPDNSITAKTIEWTIGRQATAELPSQSGTLTYTGEALTATFGGYSANKVAISGTVSGTNAGDYNATATPTSNYAWTDGSYDSVPVSWTIGRQTITTIPSQSGELTYTGEALSPTFDNCDSSELVLSGVTSATDAGDYEAEFTPDSNHCWNGGSIGAVTVSWTIGKAEGSLSISPESLTLNANNPSDIITVTRSGDGEITAESSDTEIATVSVEDNIITVNNTENGGEATVTVNVAEGTNFLAPASAICLIESKASRLPAGYTEVEYITNPTQQTSVQINTGISFAWNTAYYEMDFELGSGYTTRYEQLFYANNAYYAVSGGEQIVYRYAINVNANYSSTDGGRLTLQSFNGAKSNTGVTKYTPVSTGRHKIIVKSGHVILDDVDTSGLASTSTSYSAQKGNLYLLGGQSSSARNNAATTKLYSFKVYDYKTITLTKDYVPCINPDGVVGLYDIIGNTFLAPTATFTAGPTV